MKTKISITCILLFAQFSFAIAQSPLKLKLKWEKENGKNVIVSIMESKSKDSIFIKKEENEPVIIISPDGKKTSLSLSTSWKTTPDDIILAPHRESKKVYDLDAYFGNNFTINSPKENGKYEIRWAVKDEQSNVLTYHHLSPFSPNAVLMNNPEITWIAETETLFHFSQNDYERRGRFEEKIWGYRMIVGTYQTLKSDFSNLPISTSSRIIGHELGQLIQNETTRFIDLEGKIMNWDTVQKLVIIDESGIKLNRENSRDYFKYENNEHFTSTKPSFIVRQIWYYNHIKKELQTKVTAISPVIPFPLVLDNGCGSYGEPYYHPEAFARFGWIKLPQSPDFDFNINRKDLLWSRLSKHDYDFKNARILKGNTEKMLYQLFYQKPLNDEIAVYSADNFTKKSLPLTNVEFKEILASRMDTIKINFDPKTYQETYDFEQSPEIKLGDISKFQIVQQWYWDSELQQLAVQLKTMRPQVGIKNEKGETKWQKPLYILKFN